MTNDVKKKIKVCVDGALPLISAICEKIKLTEIIDNKSDKTDEKKVSTGKAVKAIVMNIIAGRKPLYKLASFYENTDTDKLFGEGILPENLTDDTMANALDDVYKIGAKKIMTETAMSIINEYKIPVTRIHADTTSKNVYGEYADCEDDEELLQITYGYSKDKRSDLKQILFGLGVTQERIVVIGSVEDGNKNDKDWNKDILKELRKTMKNYGLKDFVYIADSACVTEEMLKNLAGCKESEEPQIKFISRLPGTYKLEQALKQKAFENNGKWENAGKFSKNDNASEYKVQSYIDELYGEKYRFVVCSSSELDKRKQKTLESNAEKEMKKSQKRIKEVNSREFYCEKDAIEEFKIVEKEMKLNFHELTYRVEKYEKKIKKNHVGRPSRHEPKHVENIYKLEIKIHKDDVKIKKYKELNGMFVLITNKMEEEMACPDVLKEYKGQTSVETCFNFLKDPAFIDELFVKFPERLEALAYLMLIALMILTLLERNVRINLKDEIEPIVTTGKVRTFKPTGKSIIETLSQIQVILIFNEQSNSYDRYCEMNENLQRLLYLAGFEQGIYTISH
jgi:transposase